MSAEINTGFCPYCGALNPAGYNFCAQCHQALPGHGNATGPPPPPPPPPDSFQLASVQRSGSTTTFNVGRSVVGVICLYLGIISVLGGIGFFVAAGIAHQGTVTFNQACSMNPMCTPAPDPSGGLAAAGAVVLIIGIVLAVYGFTQVRKPPS
jgi:hypothetical protein